MKIKLVSIIMFLALVTTTLCNGTPMFAAETYSGKCGMNVNWTLDTSTGVLDISGNGDMSYIDADNMWGNYRDVITTVNISSGITSIHLGAFDGCQRLTNVIIPDSVMTIEPTAFSGCKSLTSIFIPSGVRWIAPSVFSDCTSLTSVVISNSGTTIAGHAFSGCSNLYDVYFSSTKPPNASFESFSGLKPGARAIVPQGVTEYGTEGSVWNGLIVTYNNESAQDEFVPVTDTKDDASDPGNVSDDFDSETDSITSEFVPVADITNVPTTATAGKSITLTGTITPSNATNKEIYWSVTNKGRTGATISGNTLSTTSAGTVTVRATITNGKTANSNYTQDFTITVSTATLATDAFLPVNNISGIPNTATAKIPLTLTGIINPPNATNKTISWSVVSKGTTGATISTNTLNTTAAGSATIRATIRNGKTYNTDYTQDFIISVSNTADVAAQYTVLVLDKSGSMSGQPMAAMKTAAIQFSRDVLEAVGACVNVKNYIAVVSYCDRATVVSSFTDDINILTSAINGLTDGGNTRTDLGLTEADILLNAVNNSNAIKNVVLLSDGAPNSDVLDTAKNTSDTMKSRGYNMYSLGFYHNILNKDTRSLIDFMTYVQNSGYYQVDDPSDLPKIFEAIKDEVLCPEGGAERYVALVLDVTGSMSGVPLTKLKQSAINFCKTILDAKGNGYVAIISYSSKAKTLCEFTDNLGKLTSVINNLKASGSTNINDGLIMADSLMSKINNRANAIKNIVLMSDGLPNTGKSIRTGRYVSADYSGYRYANTAYNTAYSSKLKGYNIYTLGFFHSVMQKKESASKQKTLKFAIRLMQDLQSHGAYNIQNPDDLEFAFGQIGREMLAPTDGRVLIRIECPVDFKITHGGETLSSYIDIDQINLLTTWGRAYFSEGRLDKKAISLHASTPLEVEMNGTNTGTMDYSITTYDARGKIESQNSIKGIPVTNKMRITTDTDKNRQPVLRYDKDGGGEIEEIQVPISTDSQPRAQWSDDLPVNLQTPSVSTSDAPLWAKPEIDEAVSLGIIPPNLLNDYDSIITRAEFCEAVIQMLMAKSDSIDDEERFLAYFEIDADAQPFADTTNLDVNIAYSLGIVNGKEANDFWPDSAILRSEAAAMLTRAAAVFEFTHRANNPHSFSDVAQNMWAKSVIDFVSANGIMTGTEPNTFSPDLSYTRAQSIATMLRLYNAFPQTNYAIH